ncbi:hypothetical protein PG989_003587 [Apiospora arundinis]
MLILGLLVDKLGVKPEEIWNRHRIGELAGDHVRITRGPPRDKEEMPEIQTPSHTDFGTTNSITVLMNWLGGLQVWSESSHSAILTDGQPDVPGEWLWVVPKPGCAIINLGDAAVKFTNGVFCSGRHRVIPAPGPQGKFPRYSVVYFVRPEDKVIMEALEGGRHPEEGIGLHWRGGGEEADGERVDLPAGFEYRYSVPQCEPRCEELRERNIDSKWADPRMASTSGLR